jgi:hypothetical protein
MVEPAVPGRSAAAGGTQERWLVACGLLVFSLLPLWAALNHSGWLNDDGLITLTFSKNLVAGNGFVFNHPPATLGTTTPLMALMVAALKLTLPWFKIESIAIGVSCAAWLGIPFLFCFFRKSWQLEGWEALVVSLFAVLPGWLSSLGTEPYLFEFLMILGLSLYFRGNLILAGLTIGLSHLARGEGALLIVVVGVYQLLQENLNREGAKRRALKRLSLLAVGFAIPVGIWFIYAFDTFGHIFPSTLDARHAWAQIKPGHSLLVRLWNEFMPRWGDHLGWRPLWWMLFALGAYIAAFRQKRWSALLLWAGLYVAGYTILDVSAHGWYQLHLIFVASIMVGLGAVACAKKMRSWRWAARAGIAPSLVFLGLLLALSAIPTLRGIREQAAPSYSAPYSELAAWFKEHASPEESIAYIEIGYLGFYTDNRIIDLAGLLDRRISEHVGKRDLSWAVWEYSPDYYISSPEFDRIIGNLPGKSEFQAIYQPVAQLRSKLLRRLVVYHKKSEKNKKSKKRNRKKLGSGNAR